MKTRYLFIILLCLIVISGCSLPKEEIDSDNDGLKDIEEESLGTNPNLFDTDGDGLSDFQEVRYYKTNPLSKNTDNDRYNDKDDGEPLNPNSAKLKLESEKILPSVEEILEVYSNLYDIGWWAEQLFIEQTKDMLVTIVNKGNDYTDGFSFDVVTYIVFTKRDLEGILCGEERFLTEVKVNIQPFSFSDRINQ